MPAPESMHARLQRFRKGKGKAHESEHELLRDMLFILQGIDGTCVKFLPPKTTFTHSSGLPTTTTEAGVEIESDRGVPQATRDLIHQLAELGWLFKRVSGALEDQARRQRGGLTLQSLYFALERELKNYYRLIAMLESRLQQQQQQDPSDGQAHQPREEEGEDVLLRSAGPQNEEEQERSLAEELDPRDGLTLRRMAVWTSEMKLRMRMMAVLVDGSERRRGGALVSLLHTYTSHGDPFIQQFTNELLEEVSRPFFSTLGQWIYEGELNDPFDEFFVEVSPELKSASFGTAASKGQAPPAADSLVWDVDALNLGGIGGELHNRGPPAHQVWSSKFRIRSEMLPKFVSESFARKIYSTGKSLNFIRYSCHDSEWIATRSKLENAGKVLRYSDMDGLEQSIEAAYSIASQRLFDIFFDKFRLTTHIRALRDYLLLGKGDFVELLMDNLGPSMGKSANSLMRHQLTACLETALRGSTAANDDADVLRRLDARMNEYSQGQVGWDCFTLEYKVDAPVDTVLSPTAMSQYERLFSQLWRTRRVEVAVDGAWMRLMTGSRTFQSLSHLQADFHRVHVALAEMVHFVRQIQYYCHLEVMECSWQALENALQRKEGDLDSLIEAHSAYLNRMVSKALLLSPKAGREEELLHKLHDIFKIVLIFHDIVDSLCNFALSEADRQIHAASSTKGYMAELPPADPATLPSLRRRIDKYATAFHEDAVSLASSLHVHADQDLRFLAMRLNFSHHYVLGQGKKRSRHERREGSTPV